jgi:hypothetical protein
MIKHVVYFHVSPSFSKPNKAIELAKHFSVFTLSVSHVDDECLIQEIKEFLVEKVSFGDKVIFYGTSLASVFATRLGYTFDVPVLVESNDYQFNDVQKIIDTLNDMFDNGPVDNFCKGDFL